MRAVARGRASSKREHGNLSSPRGTTKEATTMHKPRRLLCPAAPSSPTEAHRSRVLAFLVKASGVFYALRFREQWRRRRGKKVSEKKMVFFSFFFFFGEK